jgi:glycosyltransferase involved in cell wall biosynthesis
VHPDRTELDAAGVRLCYSVTDLRPLYDIARVFLAPIRFAAGIPIKILEATAAGLPTAGTLLMARQLGWTPGVEMIAEDDPGAFSSAVIRLHEDEGLWNQMRTAAKQRLKEHSTMAFKDELRLVLDGQASSPP